METQSYIRITKLVLLTSLILLFISCSKYEDNTGMQLQSKTNRLCKTWAVEVEGFQQLWTYKFDKNGEAFISRTIIYLPIQDTITTNYECSWSWMDDKRSIKIEYISPLEVAGFTEDLFITRLEKKHFNFDRAISTESVKSMTLTPIKN